MLYFLLTLLWGNSLCFFDQQTTPLGLGGKCDGSAKKRRLGKKSAQDCLRKKNAETTNTDWLKCFDLSDENTKNSQEWLDANVAAEERARLDRCCDGDCEDCPGDSETWSETCVQIACMQRTEGANAVKGCSADISTLFEADTGQIRYNTYDVEEDCLSLTCPCKFECIRRPIECDACAPVEGECACQGDLDSSGFLDASPMLSYCLPGEVCCNGICQKNVWPDADDRNFQTGTGQSVYECQQEADVACRVQIEVNIPHSTDCATAISEAGGRLAFINEHFLGEFQSVIPDYTKGESFLGNYIGAPIKEMCESSAGFADAAAKNWENRYEILEDFRLDVMGSMQDFLSDLGRRQLSGGWYDSRSRPGSPRPGHHDKKCRVWLYEYDHPETFEQYRQCEKDMCCLELTKGTKEQNVCNGCDEVNVGKGVGCPAGDYADRTSGWTNCDESNDNWCKGMSDSSMPLLRVGDDWDISVLLDIVLVMSGQWWQTANLVTKLYAAPIDYWKCCYNLNKCYGRCQRPSDCNRNFRDCWYNACMDQYRTFDGVVEIALKTVQSVVQEFVDDAQFVKDMGGLIRSALGLIRCRKNPTSKLCTDNMKELRDAFEVTIDSSSVTKPIKLGSIPAKAAGKFKGYCLKPMIDAIMSWAVKYADPHAREGSDTCARGADSAHSQVLSAMYNAWAPGAECNSCQLHKDLVKSIVTCYNRYPEPVTRHGEYFCEETGIITTQNAWWGCGHREDECVADIAIGIAGDLLETNHANIHFEGYMGRRLSNFEVTVLGAIDEMNEINQNYGGGSWGGSVQNYATEYNSKINHIVDTKCGAAFKEISAGEGGNKYRHKTRSHYPGLKSKGFMTNKCCSHIYSLTKCIGAAVTGAPQFDKRPWGNDYGGISMIHQEG